MRAHSLLALSLSAAGVLALDLLTKAWAVYAVTLGAPVPVVSDVVRLTLGYNTGVALAAFAVWLLRSRPAGALTAAASSLIVGGGVANVVDRLARRSRCGRA